MNKKGQVLVAFLLILPLILLIFAAIIDNGYTYIYKRKLENEIKQSIRYRFNTEDNMNIVESKIKSNLNKYSSNNKIMITENLIIIEITYERKNIFDFITNKEKTMIYKKYSGTEENGKIIIRED